MKALLSKFPNNDRKALEGRYFKLNEYESFDQYCDAFGIAHPGDDSAWPFTDMKRAKLIRADLTGADLTGAKGTSDEQIGSARLCRTIMPDGKRKSNGGCQQGRAKPLTAPVCQED